MPRGGARRGAGRPKGRKDSGPRKWHQPNLLEGDQSAKKAFREWCTEITTSGRAVELLEDALQSEDAARRDRAVTLVLAYSLGTPVSTTQMQITKTSSFTEDLEAFQRERDAAAAAALPPQSEEQKPS